MSQTGDVSPQTTAVVPTGADPHPTLRSRRTVGAVLGATFVVGMLSGCGSPSTRLAGICTDVVTGTGAIPAYRTSDPTSAVQYALARFTLVERAVSTAREASLPTADATTLRHVWLEPAVTSLATWSVRLETLRVAAVARNSTALAAALPPALAVGTVGVDVGALGRAGLPSCARAFTPPQVP